MDGPLFGPAGNSESFYEEGHKSTQEQPVWLKERGLTAYEYSFGHGVRMGEKTAIQLKDAFLQAGITISCHAPYYINFGNPEEERRAKSRQYLYETVRCASLMGAGRVVFHPGVEGKDREAALHLIKEEIRLMLTLVDEGGYGTVSLCPETMGKHSQIGDLEETLSFCLSEERLVPCVDFGHLYARSLGQDEGEEATCRILDRMTEVLGYDRVKGMHIHFSNIEYTKKGERRHHNYGESAFGPAFPPLAKEMVKRGLTPVVICESAGKMAEDAALFQKMYQESKEESA